MVRGRVSTRDEHATIRCDWATKRAAPQYRHLSDKKLLLQVGAPYGVQERAVKRALANHWDENLDSDDEHCAICIDERALALQRVKQEIPDEATDKTTIVESSVHPGSSEDAIFVHSSDDGGSSPVPIHRGQTGETQMRSSSPISTRKRHRTHGAFDDERSPTAEFSPSVGDSHIEKKKRTRSTSSPSGSLSSSQIFKFLQSIDPAYPRYVPIFTELGVTSTHQLKRLQPIKSHLRADFMSRMEQRGITAFERIIIEDAILNLPE
ncbi:hypothetical protein K439DRAFT_1611421 [Ramaria rubella]|nr:hypothetical protein K439DRAFT_1611421 [Ramaria rubella]